MSQTIDKIHSCYPLFEQDEYQTLFQNKKTLEEAHDAQRVQEVFAWTTTAEYEALNFQREALTVDPAKACQPLGAVLCALGFAGTLPYVHGSQGCVAYFRTYFNRHFKEPVACVSDSMTEDAAVFGGNNNMNLGLQNASALYKPEIIAVSTTCMAEVIGDDLQAFIANAKKEGFVDDSIAIPYAHTPSFIGSHVTGWDNMFEGFAKTFTADYAGQPGKQQKLNLVTGFETYLGNFRVLKRMMAQMDVPCSLLSDPSEVLDTPADGHYRMYAGGTSQQEIKTAPDAIDTLLLQPWQLVKSKKVVQEMWNQPATEVAVPLGLAATAAALFLTGVILSARKLQLNALIATSTIVKLLVQPFIAWGLVMLLGLHGSIAITAILMIALAAGFFGVVFGNRFGVQSPDAEAVLLLSSVLCILSLPLFISLTSGL